jgi:exosortase/archaeosortase family protein
MLSLPVVATLQFYLGFPMRAATAWCTAGLLQLGGTAIEARGTILHWAGDDVLLDAPCSGIRMLWMTLFLVSLLAAAHRLPGWRYLRLLHFGAGAVFVVNVARSIVLFFLETGQWPNPPWAHETAGLAAFLAVAGACVLQAGRLRQKADVPARVASTPPCASAGAPTLRRTSAFAACALPALVLLAALRPLAREAEIAQTPSSVAEMWPAEFEGRPIEPVALHAADARFAAGFPGAIAAFTDGTRRIVLRRVEQPTRKLHPAADCLRAAGFSVVPKPARRIPGSGLWAVVGARRDGDALSVREQIHDTQGRLWTDVSAWYWSALWHPESGPWVAATVFEEAAADHGDTRAGRARETASLPAFGTIAAQDRRTPTPAPSRPGSDPNP